MIRSLTTMATLAVCLFIATSSAVAQDVALPESVKKEVTHSAKEIATITAHLKKAVDASIKKDKSIKLNKAERQEINREMDNLAKAATALETRIAANQPSTNEAKKVVTQAKEIGEMFVARKLNGGEPWTTIMSHVQVLTKAYKL